MKRDKEREKDNNPSEQPENVKGKEPPEQEEDRLRLHPNHVLDDDRDEYSQGGWSAISLFFSVGLLLYHDKNTSSIPHFYIVGDTLRNPTQLNWFYWDILNVQQK